MDWETRVRRVTVAGLPAAGARAAGGRAADAAVERDGTGRIVAVRSGSGTFPVVACAADAGLDAVLADLDVLDLLEDGLPALMVIEAGSPSGHVPGDVLERHLLEYLPDAGAMGAAALDGDLRPPQALELTCTTCATLNTVLVYVRGRTLCVQGHPLEVDWT
ncbi:hypothetical protein [Streptomyces sp. CRN 30]|uniref:hypothetical protein n=1 Tax=Streptomyces sp. CRN 30 TaxID=3075613 RepID=UPI002A7F7894|nr:hypothetical protein [Streptomyces sp. CRN 30]